MNIEASLAAALVKLIRRLWNLMCSHTIRRALSVYCSRMHLTTQGKSESHVCSGWRSFATTRSSVKMWGVPGNTFGLRYKALRLKWKWTYHDTCSHSSEKRTCSHPFDQLYIPQRIPIHFHYCQFTYKVINYWRLTFYVNVTSMFYFDMSGDSWMLRFSSNESKLCYLHRHNCLSPYHSGSVGRFRAIYPLFMCVCRIRLNQIVICPCMYLLPNVYVYYLFLSICLIPFI